MRFAQRVVTASLRANEFLYLLLNGWHRTGSNWLAPKEYPFRDKSPYKHGHALNAQKLIDSNTRFRVRR